MPAAGAPDARSRGEGGGGVYHGYQLPLCVVLDFLSGRNSYDFIWWEISLLGVRKLVFLWPTKYIFLGGRGRCCIKTNSICGNKSVCFVVNVCKYPQFIMGK